MSQGISIISNALVHKLFCLDLGSLTIHSKIRVSHSDVSRLIYFHSYEINVERSLSPS